jgi:diguanylate cyclase (GGDEF)-like protein
VWQEVSTERPSAWPRNPERRVQASTVAPIGLTVAVAIVCISVAVLTAADQADEDALNQERELFANAILERKAELTRDLETIGTANLRGARDLIERLPDHVGLQTGLRHRVFIVDANDRFTYALPGAEADGFGKELDQLKPVIDDLRGRRRPAARGEIEPTTDDRITRIDRTARAARVQSFGGPAAIVAAVAIPPPTGQAAAPVLPSLLVSVSYLDQPFLDQIAARLALTRLRLDDRKVASAEEASFELRGDDGAIVGRFSWTPKRPGAEIVRNVTPFLGIAFGCLAWLAAFVMRHMRRTAAKIASGEVQLRHLAMHDPLSDLPNRTYFGERLASKIGEVRRTDGRAAVLSIDLDRFKDVNDTLGHLVGDALIRAVAQRLVNVVRSDDLVARLGGDEFAVIASDVPDLATLQAMSDRVIEALRAHCSIMGHTIVVGASIGIAVIERRSGEVADIMRCADVALYRAKNDGRNRACIYDCAMDADLRERKQLEEDLREAIAMGRLSIAYQPIVNPSGETLVGVEALCRWHHPTRGDIAPAEFIPVAEHSELIVPLGEWVLRQACREATAWPGLVLAVNVSPLQFRRPDFVGVVERILQETGIEPTRLELELTESTLLGNVEDAEAAMRRLKGLGVRLALDDFGTGYSSLLYLRTFPFDKLKIDRSFVRNIETAAEAAAIIHAIVSLGRGLAMKVTAEGVETAEQHLFLRAAGVHAIQGFRFGKPVEAPTIAARLASQCGGPDGTRSIAALAS